MDSTFIVREISAERVVLEHVITCIWVRVICGMDLHLGPEEQRDTAATSAT
jgi:hypothetical protein